MAFINGLGLIPNSTSRISNNYKSNHIIMSATSKTPISRTNFDPTVYLVTDRRVTPGWTIEQVVSHAIQGDDKTPGVTFLQLRDKTEDWKSRLNLGRKLREMTLNTGVAFVVNDDVDLALELQADGVHVGQDDCSIREAREKLGDNAIIGVSTGNIKQAQQAIKDGADYIGVGAVFATISKMKKEGPIGPEGLRIVTQVAKQNNMPVVAIGGINVDNVDECWRAGVNGVAVISAIMKSENPRLTACQLYESKKLK